MNEAIQTLGLTVAAPAAIALAAALLAGRWLPAGAKRFAAAVASAAGYCGGCLLVQPWGDLLPSRHFHWPFYLALAAAVAGPLSIAADPQRGIGWRVQLLAAIVAALVLVPTYAHLSPPRWVQVPLLAAYLFALAASLAPLANRIDPPTLVGLWSLAAATLAVLTAALFSLTYGIPAAIAAAALAGCWLAMLIAPDRDAAGGLCLSYALVVGGWGFIAATGIQPRLWGLLLATLAPLALWCVASQSQQRLTGAFQTLVRCALVGVVLAVAALWAIVTVYWVE